MAPLFEPSPAHSEIIPSSPSLVRFDRPPSFVFASPSALTAGEYRSRFREACAAWLAKSPSKDTRANYARDVNQFLAFLGIPADQPECLARVVPGQVAAWRDHLATAGLANAS